MAAARHGVRWRCTHARVRRSARGRPDLAANSARNRGRGAQARPPCQYAIEPAKPNQGFKI